MSSLEMIPATWLIGTWLVTSPIRRLSFLLQDVPPARLFDEIQKMMLNGHAERTYHLMREYALLDRLFPETSTAVANDGTRVACARRHLVARISKGRRAGRAGSRATTGAARRTCIVLEGYVGHWLTDDEIRTFDTRRELSVEA